jgi:hypothetical protein
MVLSFQMDTAAALERPLEAPLLPLLVEGTGCVVTGIVYDPLVRGVSEVAP